MKTVATLFLTMTIIALASATATTTATSLGETNVPQENNLHRSHATSDNMGCTDLYQPVICERETEKEVFSNACLGNRYGGYIPENDCHAIESLSVNCINPYALCAYANCTVNSDNDTASCGCYAFTEPEGISSSVKISLIPDLALKEATIVFCADSPTSCFGSSDIGNAPVCSSIREGEIWPTADLVSTYSTELETENGVNVDENGVFGDPTWSCDAALGRFVPVCMLAPCNFSLPPDTNPYHFDQHNITCTCPLVEVTVDYNVYGGFQDPCSTEATSVGSYVQATGGKILAIFEEDSSLIESAWIAIDNEFNKN